MLPGTDDVDRNSFILEGIPAVIVGVLVYFFLPDYPQ